LTMASAEVCMPPSGWIVRMLCKIDGGLTAASLPPAWWIVKISLYSSIRPTFMFLSKDGPLSSLSLTEISHLILSPCFRPVAVTYSVQRRIWA
jgi:hypothetical protein